ncbi:hypothetical protein [Noviherbaspirillum galbum]|uniref:Uncharacterized protein n=1 Tax=Noviherbaspirillum galbum TaxID=2709383 RepID=A0A6B3ST94_9BURK|nr:hypothetical protein [Noviherbaspirillum galbum]NEX62056.1 hypothetical protein [Noviherbaspirillum galbum]
MTKPIVGTILANDVPESSANSSQSQNSSENKIVIAPSGPHSSGIGVTGQGKSNPLSERPPGGRSGLNATQNSITATTPTISYRASEGSPFRRNGNQAVSSHSVENGSVPLKSLGREPPQPPPYTVGPRSAPPPLFNSSPNTEGRVSKTSSNRPLWILENGSLRNPTAKEKEEANPGMRTTACSPGLVDQENQNSGPFTPRERPEKQQFNDKYALDLMKTSLEEIRSKKAEMQNASRDNPDPTGHSAQISELNEKILHFETAIKNLEAKPKTSDKQVAPNIELYKKAAYEHAGQLENDSITVLTFFFANTTSLYKQGIGNDPKFVAKITLAESSLMHIKAQSEAMLTHLDRNNHPAPDATELKQKLRSNLKHADELLTRFKQAYSIFLGEGNDLK